MIFDFMKWKTVTFGISIAIILVGLVMAFGLNSLNQDIDFTGGASFQVEIGKAFNDADITKAAKDAGLDVSSVQKIGDKQTGVIVKTKPIDDASKGDKFKTSLVEKYGVDKNKIAFGSIGPSLGADLKSDAAKACLIASVLILLYITWRFEFLTGIAAVVALIHDILIMLAVYAIFQVPVNGSFIAAVLTVLGYSINDTVIIFDRIRENRRNTNLRRESYEQLVNKSISQTFVRSINTVMTVLITLVVLYIMGVQSIKEFAFPLIVGIVSGCYSSIFIAAPLWLIIRNASKKKPKQA